MIINGPYSQHFQSDEHIEAKIKVATIGDTFLSLIYGERKVITVYEYIFPEIITDLGPRRYVADIYFELTKSDTDIRCMSAEIDGENGHGSKWNIMNDDERDKKLSLRLKCPVVRFPTFDILGIKRKQPSLRKDLSPMTNKEILKTLDFKKNLLITWEN